MHPLLLPRAAAWLFGLCLLAASIGVVAQPQGNASPANLSWVRSASGYAAPIQAFAGGSEDGAALVLCRAAYAQGVYPGKLVKGNCNIGIGGREFYLHDYEILVGSGGSWGPPQAGYAGAFVAGIEGGRPVYVCQAPYRGGIHPGRVVGDQCSITYAGVETPVRDFAVLYAGIMTAPGVLVQGSGAAAAPPVYVQQAPPPPTYSPPATIILGRPSSCSAKGNPTCSGCSVSCPAGKQAVCTEGEVHKTSGFEPVCWTRAKCECQ